MSAGVPPSGVVTFLFTDVEGSTRRWEADADSMRAALAVHDEALRSAIEAHGGFLFKHTGDGVVAAFSSPKSAVDAAVAAQRALELPVRMGLATGEAELRDGDYFGAVLNRAARVMAAGHGGQVLLADSTAVLLSGVDLIDLGPRRLRDVPMPVGVFQVQAPHLQVEFPPLRALDTTPGNLRPATTSLIGRESELVELAAVVKSHRLVTLTGVGGVGKTRLAMEVAGRLADEFPDGSWVFELAAVADPAAVPDAVAAVLGINQQPGKTVSESVAAALEGRLRLLVFDNCEHVLDAVANLIEAVITQSATVRVLATSREGLGIAQEQVWPVPSLDLDEGIDCEAVDLFVERAQSVSPRFSMATPDEAGAVLDICQRLDGIPLAIELAASRMASMTAGDVRDRLDHCFRLLVSSRRGVQRHHTLRHTVAWSYDLLDDTETIVLNRCSVFAGGFDFQSARAIVESDGLDEYAILDVLDALVRKSLLVADRSSGRTRYSMLETVRQFAEEQLVARGDATKTRAAHSRYFAGREKDILALWDSPRQQEAYDWFTTELANLRIAFRWATDQGDVETAAAIAIYTAVLGFARENYEPIAWAEELIEPASAIGHRRCGALYSMASQCLFAGRIEAALRYSEAGQALINNGGGGEVPFGAEGLLGVAYTAAGQPDRMVEWCRAQITHGRDTHTLTWSLLAGTLLLAGRTDEAVAVASGLIEAAEATRNPFVLSFALYNYGLAFREADPRRAMEARRRGLAIARESGNRGNETALLAGLSRFEAQYGDLITAFDHAFVAIRNYHDSGNTTMMAVPLALVAAVFDRLGRRVPAATIAGFAFSPLIAAAVPEITASISHMREVLGDQTYESLARKGEAMTAAEMVAYAYDQIDQARAELSVSK
ncbi:ATP-binding protein [Mycobacterium sp. NPDC051804]|uniref:ATP-binding protein n=1 Tax=Mycobacterium sp. NPDC051804 TaxID=3364295 RepID=UPI00378D4B60